MKRTIFKIIFLAGTLLAGSLMISSCDTDLDLVNPSYQTPENYFNNAEELKETTNSIYSMLSSGMLFGREWFFVQDLRSDEVAAGGGQLEAARAQILNGNTTPTNNLVIDVWNGLYNVIHRANTVITNGSDIEDNPQLRDRLIGEAKYLRGWAYYELVTLWGGVPIYTEPVGNPNQAQPRSSVDLVYTQIIEDLTDAADVLPWPSGYQDADRGRATKGAAEAMLGRTYMQQLDFENAKIHFDRVITSNEYDLVDNYLDNFLEETEFNEESIFEVVFVQNVSGNFNWGYTGDGPTAPLTTVRNQEYSPVAWRNLIPSDDFLMNFEHTLDGSPETDPRLGMSVYFTGDTYNDGDEVLTDDVQNGNTSNFYGQDLKISWKKYSLLYKQSFSEAQFMPGGINHRKIRYAEILLNMAEVENELNNPSVALDYLNEVRSRPSVDMPDYPTADYPANTKEQIWEIIFHEKMAELASEGIRNKDLLRWRDLGYIDSGNDPLSYYQAPRDRLLPLPQIEIDNNPEISSENQNPGY